MENAGSIYCVMRAIAPERSGIMPPLSLPQEHGDSAVAGVSQRDRLEVGIFGKRGKPIFLPQRMRGCYFL
jgi:hypothetical protein